MEEKVSQGTELKAIIESHGWTLYDVSNPPGRALTWEELEDSSPATEFLVRGQYLFVPIPADGQTLREAYVVTKGLGPSLWIDEHKGQRWKRLALDRTPNLAVFTRLAFTETRVTVFSSKTAQFPNPDMVGMSYETVVDTFRQFFRIVTAEEYGTAVQAAQLHQAMTAPIFNEEGNVIASPVLE